MKSLNYFLTTVLFIFCFLQLQAQTYTLKGYIFDQQTRQPLSGVNIATADSTVSATTNEQGFFKIKTEKSKGKLLLSSIGYSRKKIPFSSQNHNFRIHLKPSNTTLNTVIIKSFNRHTKNKATPGAIAVIQKQELHQGNAKSIQAALNSIPGIRMDQTGVSEGRLSIRGMGARAPWGIRKVRVYLNDIPLTGADGITSWDDINVNTLGRVEIIRGPSSSIYGSGTTGGVINFEMERAKYGEHNLKISGLVGAYGLHRVMTSFKSGAEKMSSYVSFGYQELGGYRDHSKDMQRFFAGNFQFFPSTKQTISLLFTHTSQYSELPGMLNRLQVENDRKQASAISLNKDTRRYITRTRLGVNQKYHFNNKFSNSTSIYTYFMDFKEPLAYGIPSNFTQSLGGRTYFTYEPGFHALETKFIMGAEVDQDKVKSILYANDHGEPGAIWSNVDHTNTLYTFFYQSKTKLSKKASLTLGLSYSGLNYDIRDYTDSADNGMKKFGPRFSPRIALSYNFGSALTLHASVSTGYNPPNTEEIKNPDNTINRHISAEEAVNYELDAKGSFFENRLNYNLAIFRMNMHGELIGQTPLQGLTVYHNSGKTRHEGVELSIAYQILNKKDHKSITSLKPYLAVTYSHFRFIDYDILDENNQVKASFDGNSIPGIGPWMVYFGLNLKTKWGVYFSGNYRFNDRFALNDANTDYNAAYQVINGKIGYKTALGKHFNLDVFAGLNNMTNSHYSTFSAINAKSTGGALPAYFQPAPERNGYTGVSIKYNF